MRQYFNLYKLFTLILFSSFFTVSSASNTQELEKSLTNSLSLKGGSNERLGNSGETIRSYMKEGFVNKKPNQRADYTDYYLLKKPAMFMGHELLVIEEEYMSKYIGCCVSPGIGVTVKIYGSSKSLDNFAVKNKCTLTNDVDIQAELKSVSVKANFPRGQYASLSCRERDANR
jgi:hypothetical protein